MLKNYIKIAWRNLAKNKVSSFVNISGLAVGLAGFIVILLYVNYERSYDKWDPSLESVYKVSVRTDEDILTTTYAPLADFLRTNSATIESATRIQPSGDIEIPIKAGEKTLYVRGSIESDSLFFKVFPYKIIIGNKATALQKPNALVISRELSQRLFGNVNPIGKTVKLFNIQENEITAVMEVPAGPSHLNAQFVWRSTYEKQNMWWENQSYQTYVKTKHPIAVNELEKKLDGIYYNQRIKKGNQSLAAFRKAGHQAGLFVDAVKDLHNFPKYGSSNFTTVSALLVLAALLLVAGAINFSNLSIAASLKRTKEVGMRKVMGSNRIQLFWQFMGESTMQCILSLALAAVLVSLVLPLFNVEFHVDLSFFQSKNIGLLSVQIAGCLLLVIALSGLYPAIFLSYFNPAKVLKGDYSTGKKGMAFRNTLIVLQFTVAAFFISATLIINRQMEYMQSKDKGFSGGQVMRIEAMQKTREEGFEPVKSALLDLPGVFSVAKTTAVPGDKIADTSTHAFKTGGLPYRMASVKVSDDYFKTLQIKLLQGRYFDGRFVDENTQSAIVNEAAVQKMKLKNPVGKTITFNGCDSIPVQIVGVVKNFNVQSFESAIQPVVYTIGNKACMYQSGGGILLKLNGKNLQKTIAGIEQAWKKIDPDIPIRYSFLDDNFQNLFASYIRLQKIISFFAGTAIFISVMGLFALTAYLIMHRNKEISIRKVLGAGLLDIVSLLSRDFLRLILIAIVIAAPIGYWATNQWLQTFAYRIDTNWLTFIYAALVVFLIAGFTISFQVIKTAVANPVKSLRSE